MKKPPYVKHWNKILFILQIISLILIFSAFLMNPYTVAKLLKKEQQFSETTDIFLYKLELIILFSGAALFLLQRFYLKRCSERAKDTTLTLMILLLSIILALSMSEAAVRLFAPQKTLSQLKSLSPPIYEEGEYFSWQYKPNSTGRRITGESNISYNINSLGMRDQERNLSKKEGVERILVLGDSVTEGFGVEPNETFTKLLEDILNQDAAKTDKIYEVWNAGVDGYSPDIEYVYLKNNIKRISPDAVMLILYAGNDIADISKNSWEVDAEGLPVSIKSKIAYVKDDMLRFVDSPDNPYQTSFLGYVDMSLLRYSHLYILIKNNLDILGPNGDFQSASLMLKHASPEIISNLEKTEKLIYAMNNLSLNNNIPFIIVIFPARIQVNDKEWGIVEKKFSRYGPQRDLVQEKVSEWCVSANISCIDLLDDFRASKQQLYFVIIDIHPNKEGHKLTASLLKEKIHLS